MGCVTRNFSNVSCLWIYRQQAGRRGMLRIDETLVGSRIVNCAIREGRDKHTIKVQLQEGVQHRHRAGIAASGWIKRGSRSWVSSALWSGAASH